MTGAAWGLGCPVALAGLQHRAAGLPCALQPREGAGGPTKGFCRPGKGVNSYVMPARVREKFHRSKKKMEEVEEEDAPPPALITPDKTWCLSAEGLSQKLPGLRDAPFPGRLPAISLLQD